MEWNFYGEVMTTTDTTAQSPQELSIDVVGMHCNGCANTIREGAAGVAGVSEASVDLKAEQLRVLTDGSVDATTMRTAIAAAVESVGYGVKEEEEWS